MLKKTIFGVSDLMENSNEKDLKIKSNNYSASNIQVLEGLDAVRKRPGMYIGDTGVRGLHHLVYEVVDNSIDEALAGFCTQIDVMIRKDGFVCITDNGRGIPVDKHSSGKSALEVVMTVLHAGGKFDNNTYKVSGGLHGVGVSVVNALSQNLEVRVKRDSREWIQLYEYGKPTCDVKNIAQTSQTGTSVAFKPDGKIFETTEFSYDILSKRLRELAYLNKGITITISDERDSKNESFYFVGGIAEFVSHLNKNKTILHPVIYFEKEASNVMCEVSLQYNNTFNDNVYAYVNSIHTIEGGTHLAGFKSALTRSINEYSRQNKVIKEGSISGDDLKEGLCAIISVKIQNPQFEGQTKTKLGNTEVKGIVEQIVGESLRTYFEENPADARAICLKAVSAMQAREAAQKAKDLIRRKSVLESSVLPGKLADCTESDPKKCELYIVEGDSAGGSAKQGRDRKIQAILPLRGKILNVEKASINKFLESVEIRNLIMAIGTNFGSDFDMSKIRYDRIIIMTDADVDGAHIRTLILTLFFRYLKPLVEQGHVYIAQPPLYKLKASNRSAYAYDDAELAKLLSDWGNPKGYHVQRYKGLGEMNPAQLWETTMDPKTRTMLKVTIDDAMKADELFTILMGDAVEPRRKFIEENALKVQNLDI